MDDLTNHHNNGLVPAPATAPDHQRLRRPNWIPTTAQVETARKILLRNLLILALGLVTVSVLSTLLGGF